MTDHKKHLYYLNELSDYKISDGYPDVRGWDVKDFDNRVIGKVDNLLANVEAERLVYLDVEVDKSIIDSKHDPYARQNQTIREFVNKDGENHIIIPIGLVDINTDSNYVYTDAIDHRTFAETKRYRKGDGINRAYEVQVLDSYERRTRTSENDPSTLTESRIRDIVREEIKEYHNKAFTSGGYSDKSVDTHILTVEEEELERRRHNNEVYDDDRFYERPEFDDRRFKRRKL